MVHTIFLLFFCLGSASDDQNSVADTCFVIGDLADMAPKSAQVTSVCVVVWVGISWLLQNLGCCTVISSQIYGWLVVTGTWLLFSIYWE